MDIYLARQPIFNKSKEIFAYELLFRGGMENCFPNIDGDTATSRVLSDIFFNTGVEQITGGKLAFINFPRDMLIKKIPLMFPSEITALEILENVIPDEEVIGCCREFTSKGYILALDDFEYSPHMEPLINLGRFIKIDFMKSSKDEIKEYASRFIQTGKRLLAEKVETEQEFEEALDMGFSYFQGYFFSKPQVIKNTEVPSFKMNLIRIMGEARRGDYDVSKLQKLIEQDVGISYKLLRYLNSPFFRRRNEITSIRQAIVMLGEKGMRSFLSVIILAELSQDKPDELIKSSVIRARMCEQLRLENLRGPDSSELFTMGLFSHIDAILDNSMENILKKLPLSEVIKVTLAGKKSVMSDYLDLVVSYQKADWDNVSQSTARLGVSQEKLPQIYLDALGWADSIFQQTS